MDDKRNEQNKKIEPAENKGGVSVRREEQERGYSTSEPTGVRIRFFPMRACEGVAQDAEGYATVDAALAEHLIKIKYAVKAEE